MSGSNRAVIGRLQVMTDRLLTVMGSRIQRRQNDVTYAVLFFVVVCTAYFLLQHFTSIPLPRTNPDSPTYINFGPERSPGYPLFIKACQLLHLGLNGVIVGQIALLSAGLLYLYRSLTKLTGAALVSALISMALALFPTSMIFHFSILTESFVISLQCFLWGAVSRWFISRSIKDAILVSIFVGLMILVRPAAWSFALVPVIMLFAANKACKLWACVVAALGPVLALALMGNAFGNLVHGSSLTHSMMTRQLFEKSMMVKAGIAPGSIDNKEARLWNFVEEKGDVVRRVLSKAPSNFGGLTLKAKYESLLTPDYMIRSAIPYAMELEHGNQEAAYVLLRKTNFDRLTRAWPQYALLIVKDYVALWTPCAFAMNYESMHRFAAANSPLPFVTSADEYFNVVKKPFVVVVGLYVSCLFFFAAGTATVVMIPLLIWRLLRNRNSDGMTYTALIAAIAANANFALVAATAPALSRYTAASVPTIIIAIALFGHICWQYRRTHT